MGQNTHVPKNKVTGGWEMAGQLKTLAILLDDSSLVPSIYLIWLTAIKLNAMGVGCLCSLWASHLLCTYSHADTHTCT